jgi:flagellar biosynthesis/type III secretory pathway M-ring protein FliF/YscJ
LDGKDVTNDSAYQLLPSDQMQHSPVSAEEKKKKYQEMILSRWPYIFVGCLVGVILIIALIIWRCCKRRRARRAAAANRAMAGPGGEMGMGPTSGSPGGFKNPFGKKEENEAYLPLSAQGSSVNLSLSQNHYNPQHQQQHPQDWAQYRQ